MHDQIGPLDGSSFLEPSEVLVRLARAFDQLVVSRFEAQLLLQEMPKQARDQIDDSDDCYSICIMQGLKPEPTSPPEQSFVLQVFGKGVITVLYRDEAHRTAASPLLERVEATLGYGGACC